MLATTRILVSKLATARIFCFSRFFLLACFCSPANFVPLRPAGTVFPFSHAPRFSFPRKLVVLQGAMSRDTLGCANFRTPHNKQSLRNEPPQPNQYCRLDNQHQQSKYQQWPDETERFSAISIHEPSGIKEQPDP